ncbi:MAG: UDP-N-acetylmuramoyl-tripeptide--D-alanyl-D-alanine ligase [Alphaproteobacteria bacterium]
MKTILWTAEEAAQAVHALNAPAVEGWQATGISIDTRSLQQGDIFIALKGPNHDGHDHASAALDAGAAGVIVSQLFEGVQQDDPRIVMVEDTTQALEDLGRVARHRATDTMVIGVTGSVGKTTVKTTLGTLLGMQARTTWPQGSLNNHFGVPLSLSRLPRDDRFAVFELGMNHAGELSTLTRQVQPHIAIITNIAAVHIEHFDGVEAIADAKAEILEGMGRDGTAILPRDNEHYPRLLAAARTEGIGTIISFGMHDKAEARLVDYATRPDGGSQITADILGETVSVAIPLRGEHQAINALAILAAIKLAGGNLRQAASDYIHIKPVEGRGTRQGLTLQDGGRVTLVDEAYNASPLSTSASLKVLGDDRSARRRVAMLGDMLELGEHGPDLHAGLAAACDGVNVIHTAGPLMKNLHAALPETQRGQHFEDASALAASCSDLVAGGDTIMVKGSNGSRMKLVVEAVAGLDTKTDAPSGGTETHNAKHKAAQDVL